MAFIPQNFKAQVGPAIKAVWLNALDVTVNSVLGGAQTVAQALTALGLPAGGIPTPVTTALGGTGTINGNNLLFAGTDSGVVNAYVVAAVGLAAPVAGTQIRFTPGAVNTGPSTLAGGTGAAQPVTNWFGAALTGGEINGATIVEWTGAAWQIVSSACPVGNQRTPAELAAEVTPVNFGYAPGNVLRYGIVANSSGAGAMNATLLQSLLSASVTNGPTGQFYFPNTTGADVYTIAFALGGCITVRDGCSIDLQGCTLNLTGTGVSNDSDSGFFFAIRDFEMKNGTLNVTWATGPSTSSGNAIQIGARGTNAPRWPVAVYDSLLAVPMGRVSIHDLRINSTITGANLSGCAAIGLIGGIHGLNIERVIVNGQGTLWNGISYEYGYATNPAAFPLTQTSHMRDWKISNCEFTNMGNSGSTETALSLVGVYGGIVENCYFSGVSNGITIQPGQASFYRPWIGVDDVGAKRNVALKNITGQGYTSSGINITGTSAAAVGDLAFSTAWAGSTAYSNGGGAAENSGQVVINGGNAYVCKTSGTSASSGGPTGTGTGISDGSCTWDYVPLTAITDLQDVAIDGFALSGTSAADGIQTSAGYMAIRNGTLTGHTNGIFFFAECTRFDIEGVQCTGAQNAGFELGSTAGKVWSTQRLKKGTIKNCYVWGNSVASSGASAGIDVNYCQGVLIENNRINADSAYNGVADATQGDAVEVGTTGFGVVCRNNHVGTVNGSSYAYQNINAALNGNDIVSPTGVITQSGGWNSDGSGNGTTTNLGDKTSNVNTYGKRFGRRVFNTSNGRLLFANGPATTDVWNYCDQNAPGTITPA